MTGDPANTDPVAAARHALEVLQREGPSAPRLAAAGIALVRVGNTASAEPLLARAVRLAPGDVLTREALALTIAMNGGEEAALPVLRSVLILAPGRAAATFNLGHLLLRQQGAKAAVRPLSWSTALQPDHADTRISLADALRRLDRIARADAHLERARSLGADGADFWFHLGKLRADQARQDEADRAFRTAIARDPRAVEARADLGNHLRLRGRREAALAVLRRATLIDPGYARPWSGLAAAALELDDPALAGAAADRAILADAGFAEGWANRAQTHIRRGDAHAAVAAGERAVTLDAGNKVARFNLATYRLCAGDLARGWADYEVRLENTRGALGHGRPAARWTEGPPPGRRLLVTAEQGVGDEILSQGCLPDLARMLSDGALEAVTMEADRRLLDMLRRAHPGIRFVARLVGRDGDPSNIDYGPLTAETGADCWSPAGSLPRIFRPDLASFPATARFLEPDPDQVLHWRGWLAGSGAGPWIGLCWRSRAGRDQAASYYPDAAAWGRVLSLPRVRFVNLQYDQPEPELAAFEAEHGITIARPPNLDLFDDLAGVTALVAALDGVVSAHTSIVNLAGAIGSPVLVATHTLVWPTLGTDGLPWYPSLRLVTKGADEDWNQAMTRVAVAIDAWRASR